MKAYFMSDRDQLAALGQLVTDYSSKIKRFMVLEAEAKRIGDALQDLGRLLSNQPDRAVISDDTKQALSSDIGALVGEIKTLKADLAIMKSQLAPFGFGG